MNESEARLKCKLWKETYYIMQIILDDYLEAIQELKDCDGISYFLSGFLDDPENHYGVDVTYKQKRVDEIMATLKYLGETTEQIDDQS
ncbi:MAG: hypothetical protein A2V60_02345 [Candidatus Portnoybacteria bacterium RIFCSPHIGHO2_01_FULL_39_19]|nr:MAG: hypothetical protein A2V60_02345 [Candidatus Portnoybacteria bacterium RIFCSPHIGHO2_01_FULL_39_19]